MIPGIRSSYNEAFSEKTYQAFLSELHSVYPGAIEFRVAETPVPVPYTHLTPPTILPVVI